MEQKPNGYLFCLNKNFSAVHLKQIKDFLFYEFSPAQNLPVDLKRRPWGLKQ